MPDRLIAEFRYGGIAHIRATKIKDMWWFRVRLGKKRILICDCGGTIQDLEGEYHDSWGGCSHLVELYQGNVTSDTRVNVLDYSVSKNLWRSKIPHFARLTVLGQKMFHHRWLALKWKD